MRLAVFIKQVPAVDSVRINEETGTMERDDVESELNPLDLYALEAAIRIGETVPGAKITAVTMGPPQARKILSGAIAMGCDDGVLLSDRKFAGADTLATARVLAACVEKLGGFDLMLAGERATDGETGQVAPAVARFLGCPSLTYVCGVENLCGESLTVRRAVEGGHEVLWSPLPAVISVTKEMNRPRFTTLGGKLRAKGADIRTMCASDVGLPDSAIGLAGSPTRVSKVLYPKVTRSGKKYFMAVEPDDALCALVDFLSEGGFAEEARSR